MIPIVLLHYNQPDVLRKCVESIIKNTRHAFCLYVVDNNSPGSSELTKVKELIESLPNGHYIQNSNNNWIYGFNLALEDKHWKKNEYYVFSDADIVFPETGFDLCWLGCLVQQMEKHCCIGKLGLNLSLDNLKDNPNLVKTYQLEAKFQEGPKIGSNVVAPVDTTAAIYRDDYFIFGFKFRIGHALLGKPHYYICRTSVDLSCIHLGWDYYPGAHQEIDDISIIKKKIFNMAKMGAYIAPEIIKKIPASSRVGYFILRLFVRMLHGAKVVFLFDAISNAKFSKEN